MNLLEVAALLLLVIGLVAGARAIGSAEAVARLGPFVGATAAVDTGACL